MKMTCPVCGFDNINEPKLKWSICPSCGTQFGLSDSHYSYSELREMWIRDKNMAWQGPESLRPLKWSPIIQLFRAGFINYDFVSHKPEAIESRAKQITIGRSTTPQDWTNEPIRVMAQPHSQVNMLGTTIKRTGLVIA